MRIAFLYNRSTEDPTGFAEDDDPQRSPVVAAIRRLGHDVAPIACTLDLGRVKRKLIECEPAVVFNRVESLGGSDALAVTIAMLLDAMQIPYTGCHTESLVAATSKTSVKDQLLRAGLRTPEWIDPNRERLASSLPEKDARVVSPASTPTTANSRYILKSVYEHASFQIGDDAIVGPACLEEIAELVRQRSADSGKPFFAERFIEGREFNLSLLGQGPDVLPPAEIDFSAFPPSKPRIVGHGAKWAQESFEFQNTPRRFDFPTSDEVLLHQLKRLATDCWRLFGLRGYARVDFRVDTLGNPWILEINANPCIAPTSGFAAAIAQAGLSYEQGIAEIISAAIVAPIGADLLSREPVVAG